MKVKKKIREKKEKKKLREADAIGTHSSPNTRVAFTMHVSPDLTQAARIALEIRIFRGSKIRALPRAFENFCRVRSCRVGIRRRCSRAARTPSEYKLGTARVRSSLGGPGLVTVPPRQTVAQRRVGPPRERRLSAGRPRIARAH